MKRFERLGEARTPEGTLLELFRHDGHFLIRAAGIELMSSRRHRSEDELAVLGCEALREQNGARVLIGGLGLGFTLRAALEIFPADAEVVVAELMTEVIAWNRDPALGISVDALADPRVRVEHADVADVLMANPGGFDAIMLDTDNGPDGMLISENARLYAAYGVERTIAALRPGGRIVYWSVGEDRRFLGLLRRSGLEVEVREVPAHDTVRHLHLLFVAVPRRRKGAADPAARPMDGTLKRRKE